MLTDPNDVPAANGDLTPASSAEPARDLSRLRDQVDAIDDQIIELISKRIELATLIMKSKPASQIVDPSREQAIVRRYFDKLGDRTTLAKVKRLVSGIIETSKVYPDA